MIYVYGTDPFAASPSSKTLLKELVSAGFKPKELEYVVSAEDIPDDSWVLSFGADAFRTLTGCDEPLSKHHGSLFDLDINPSVFVFPTYSPGYLFHNPKLIGQWKAELELFKAFISYDQKGA